MKSEELARSDSSTNSSGQVEQVVSYIDRLIGKGVLLPGDAVREPEIGSALGVGRVPVREALRILAGEGLLELIPNRGAQVRIVDAREVLEMLEVLTSLSVTAIHSLTARGISKEFQSKISQAAEAIVKAADCGDATLIMKGTRVFHNILISNCGNEYLQKLVRKMRIFHYSRSLVQLLGLNAFKEAAPNYPKIARAIAKGDGAAAGRILMRSVRRSASYADGRRLEHPQTERARYADGRKNGA
jgi:DNA-binding GntR family transcriptional regulator